VNSKRVVFRRDRTKQKETGDSGLMKGKEKACCVENYKRYRRTEGQTDLEGEIKD
jgi:hypothetical protein